MHIFQKNPKIRKNKTSHYFWLRSKITTIVFNPYFKIEQYFHLRPQLIESSFIVQRAHHTNNPNIYAWN